MTSIDQVPGDSGGTSYSYSTFSGDSVGSGGVICFVAGTQILTEGGSVPVERIAAGCVIQTADNGLKRVIWAGSTTVTADDMVFDPGLRPVRIETGAFGNKQPLLVSQQHRIAVGDGLVKAKHLPLIPGCRARIARGIRPVRYYHLLLEDHQMVIANGVESESLFPGPMSARILRQYRFQIDRLDVLHRYATPDQLCRPMIKRHQVKDAGLWMKPGLSGRGLAGSTNKVTP